MAIAFITAFILAFVAVGAAIICEGGGVVSVGKCSGGK